MLVRRTAIDQVGLFDEGYFMHCEDLDWCMRFRLAGWRVVFVPDAVVTHEKGVSSRSRPVFVEWHKHRGMARYYRKFFASRYPLILMPFVMLAIWARFGAVALRHLSRRLMGVLGSPGTARG
jgi:GT2 family glycosyltransferase